jgi:hypothetical protein
LSELHKGTDYLPAYVHPKCSSSASLVLTGLVPREIDPCCHYATPWRLQISFSPHDNAFDLPFNFFPFKQ